MECTSVTQDSLLELIEHENLVKNKKLKKKRKHSESSESSLSSLDGSSQYLKIKIDKTKVLQKVESLKQKVKFLLEENQNLRKENLVLRNNNIKFQIEIFNLQNAASNPTQTEEIEEEENSYEAVETLDYSSLEADEVVFQEVEEFEEAPLKTQNEMKLEDIAQDEPEFPYEDVQEQYTEHYIIHEDLEPQKPAMKKEKKPKLEDHQTYALQEPGQSQQEILERFSIEIKPSDLEELNSFGSGQLNDQKFINKLLMVIFDKKTLAESSVTGKPSNNQNYEVKHCYQMDPTKIAFIKALLEERLTREQLTPFDLQSRAKRLNYMVRSKINNVRKHFYKDRKTI